MNYEQKPRFIQSNVTILLYEIRCYDGKCICIFHCCFKEGQKHVHITAFIHGNIQGHNTARDLW